MRRLGMLLALAVLSLPAVVAAQDAARMSRSSMLEDELKRDYRRPAAVPFPADNPWTPEREQLGRMLFFDPRLSSARVTSCATCHNPGFSWGDALPKAIGYEHVYSLTEGLAFDLRSQAPGQSDTVTFSRQGTALVECAIHPRMKLQVVVTP